MTNVSAPAGFAPLMAIAFEGGAGGAIPCTSAAPLPVQVVQPGTATSLTGTAVETGGRGPFEPLLGRPIRLTLTGVWTGQMRLLRSIDGGATRLPLTIGGQPWGIYTANVQEVVADEQEAGATYWLDIALSSGSVNYRVAQ